MNVSLRLAAVHVRLRVCIYFFSSHLLSTLPHFSPPTGQTAPSPCATSPPPPPQSPSACRTTSLSRPATGIVYLISVYMADGATCNLSGFSLSSPSEKKSIKHLQSLADK